MAAVDDLRSRAHFLRRSLRSQAPANIQGTTAARQPVAASVDGFQASPHGVEQDALATPATRSERGCGEVGDVSSGGWGGRRRERRGAWSGSGRGRVDAQKLSARKPGAQEEAVAMDVEDEDSAASSGEEDGMDQAAQSVQGLFGLIGKLATDAEHQAALLLAGRGNSPPTPTLSPIRHTADCYISITTSGFGVDLAQWGAPYDDALEVGSAELPPSRQVKDDAEVVFLYQRRGASVVKKERGKEKKKKEKDSAAGSTSSGKVSTPAPPKPSRKGKERAVESEAEPVKKDYKKRVIAMSSDEEGEE
ncbi:hypothetical protein JCM11641_006997 [Rhodosporidiobolus odoratus]